MQHRRFRRKADVCRRISSTPSVPAGTNKLFPAFRVTGGLPSSCQMPAPDTDVNKETHMPDNKVVSHEEWLKARLELLAAEKEFTRQRDALTRRRMGMPWERVEKSYQFEGPNGALSLADLFDGRSQLIVYHFMFAPIGKRGASHALSGPTISMPSRSISIIAMWYSQP